MTEAFSSLIRPHPGPQLPAFERLARSPAENVIEAELTARTAPGDVVVDVHGRGGWVARAAIGSLRRAYACESMALTRLMAEVVLRPPDLRHFDAGIAALAGQPRGDVELRRALNQPFTSRCPSCGRPVTVDEYIWEADEKGSPRLVRKLFRCTFCKEQSRGNEQRLHPVDEDDLRLVAEFERASPAYANLRARFPLPPGEAHSKLPDELLALYTPRQQAALEAIISRLESDLRAAPVDAGMRLGLVHALLPMSRLNGYPGRLAALRVRHGHVQQPGSRAWRERNPWLAFEEGCQEVRQFIVRLQTGTASFQPRPGDDLEALVDGAANVVLRTGSPAVPGTEPRFAPHRPILPGRLDPRSRVRLVLSQLPVQWSVENASFAYLATALVLGRAAAADLPLAWVFGPPPRNDRGREATALRHALLAVRPVLARDGRAVLLLDRGGASLLVAGVLGGIGAGFRLASAVLNEAGNQIGGVLEFDLQRDPLEEPIAREEGEEAPFALADVEQAVSDVAVSVLQARGEPATAERLLGEVLIGLDRLGHLRRLVATQTFAEAEAATEAEAAPEAEAPEAEAPAETAPEPNEVPEEQPAEASAGQPEEPADGIERAPGWALGSGSATDHVRLLMELVMGELRRPDNPRLVEIERGRWWLRDGRDLAETRPPLSDRLEWAAYGLLSAARGITESTFYQRIADMFVGYDTPDPELVRAVLDSYAEHQGAAVFLRASDGLAARHTEHGELVGMLVEYGHRLGLRCYVSAHERRRAYGQGHVADLLSDDELRAYAPLIASGDAAALEQIDCIWYLRGKATFMFEVEWTAMLTDALLRRGARIPADETVVRFLVIPAERTELVRFKLARSPLLRRALDEHNWHILKSDHLRQLLGREEAGLDQLAPVLGLDPEIERQAEQLPLFA
jgi:hypothetical protein